MFRCPGALDVDAIRRRGHGDGMWLVSRVREEQKKLVLACAAAGTAETHERAGRFQDSGEESQQKAAKNGALCVERITTRLSRYLYVCDAHNGGLRQHTQYLEALGVMCKRKRSWSGRRS
jgi:hypothetical protein